MSGKGLAIEERPQISDAKAVLNKTTHELQNASSGAPLQHMKGQLMEKKFEIEWLDLSSSVIDVKETKMLARALESNQLPKLKVLFLQGNAGDSGARATLNALRAGYLTGLKKIILWEFSSYNQITTAEEGTDVIADALSDGLLPNLDTMDLTGTLPKLVPARMFAETIKDLLMKRSCGGGRLQESLKICLGCLVCTTDEKRNHTLECLRWKLQVYSGDDGIRKIGRAFKNKPIDSLRILILQQNYIRDKGAASLAKILRTNAMPHLEELDLRDNQVSCIGAEKIVTAFLKNPLLTVRVKLDWPNLSCCLLKEKAVAFRDNNIRLEHRLETLKIPRESLVVDEYKEFDYYLNRPHKQGLGKFNHRLHLLCHAQYGNGNHRFKSHRVEPEEGAEEPEGIEIRRRRPIFCNTYHKFVDRDLESESSGDEEPVYESPSEDEKDTSGELSSSYHVTSNGPTTLGRKETALKRRTGVNRIYITSNTCGFVGAAKALGSQIGRNPNPSAKIWPWHRPKKTRRQMDTIKEELLMLAERKPDEFYNMFHLRQVLLRNPKRRNRYSRVWICKSCFVKYSEQQMQDEFGHPMGPNVQPITTDAEVDPRGHHSHRRSGSSHFCNSSEVNHQLTCPSSRSGLLKDVVGCFKSFDHM